ncbi:lactoylglutathione lyase [Kurthia sibirica]|nr:lactoylglutathione lyase [Kurthia sibirica]
MEAVKQIMLYVNDQQATADFWVEKLGFTIVANEKNGGFHFIEMKPNPASETSIVLHNKEMIAKMSPEMNVGTPSLMFSVADVSAEHQRLKEAGVKVGELTQMPFGTVFNFCDNEENYFAVSSK